MISTSNQIASKTGKTGINASTKKRTSRQGRSFKCCDNCGDMAPANNKKICDGCRNAFPIKKNESSLQGRSFKLCGECGDMAGSNNQIKCKGCSSTNWALRQAVKRPGKRKAVGANNLPKKPVKKRKTSGKNMLDDILVLLKDPPSKQAPSPKDAENDGLGALDALDFLEPSENMLDDAAPSENMLDDATPSENMLDDAFDDLMSSMAADVDPSAVGNSQCQSPTDDTMFDEFLQEMGLSTTEDTKADISSDEWMDNVFSEMGTSDMKDAMFDEFLQETGLSTTEDTKADISSDEWMDNVFSEMGTSDMINDISV